ncbi:hypothetical protein AQUCO_02700176v1 [Aquilegia coerulea]|uniref:THO1-MOS11 C-terminal domain-containing protein n=1 Tax=Aquilegia coerulea TaxID=218851 RepID=A0A2G5D5L4_AQUCA|nr:hypothetical protein AQUCO_02700176v1 [Aquilegia coerulea]
MDRFGTAPISHGSDGLKAAEEQKRKARAERFGLSVQSVADEEAKKKARLARFAPVSKTSPEEEEKRKARAARSSLWTTNPSLFLQTPSGTTSQINAKTNSEKEVCNVDKASVKT